MKVTSDCGIVAMFTSVTGIDFVSTGKSPKEACTGLACKLVNYIQDRYLDHMSFVEICMTRVSTAIANNMLGSKLRRAIADGYLVDFGVIYKDYRRRGDCVAFTGENMGEVFDLLSTHSDCDSFYVDVSKYTNKDRDLYCLRMTCGNGENNLDRSMFLAVVTDDLDFKVNGCCALEVKKKAWGKIMEHLVEHNLRVEEE